MSVMLPSDNIHSFPLFLGLTEFEKNELIQCAHIRQIARNEMLFTQGDPVSYFYFIINGTIQLFRTNIDGHEKTIAIIKSGQTMCEDEIMDSCQNHRVNAQVVEDSAIMEFPALWLKNTAKKHSTFALNLLSLIANHAHMAEVEAEHQATMSAAQLVACFMQRLCILYGFNPEGFDLPYSKTLIASRLGMELETFSRTLNKLKEHGISINGNRVTITDLKRIEKYVCNFCSISEECETHHSINKKTATQ
ncbi:MAG: Crp/Fnr family transcriptional regulator [Alphaproteobacteria bacterium]|nr:Crp/Fnr family transcriptional regulator [Alphaproteobacteria bacterium]